ncbi:head maturation protease, ClpP-related [Actinomadura sp. 21ATH]|uniref:head maturation protease, ClpP-related n=1 Tax=Actinomadura sp. 21ATH TaxID=1735444 RepID=UPI0035C1738F
MPKNARFGKLLNRTGLRDKRPRALLQTNREWYRLTNLVDEGFAELMIFDEIGFFGLTAGSLVDQLSALDTPQINVRINSPGGEIFDGIAIHNALRSHQAKVNVRVEGIAASIASVIAMAGDEVEMAPHSQMMIHDGMGVAIGNAQEMREMADLLDRQSDNIAAVYAEKAGGRKDSWRKKMRAETWYTAQEAVEAGLADKVATPPKRRTGEEVTPEEEPENAFPEEEEEEPGEQAPGKKDGPPKKEAPGKPKPGDDEDEDAPEEDAPDEDDEEDEEKKPPAKAKKKAKPPAAEFDLSIFKYPGREHAPAPLAARATRLIPDVRHEQPAAPTDDWAALTAHLDASSDEDEFARLREAMQ